MVEKRHFSRLPFVAEVRCRALSGNGGGPLMGSSRNISRNGIGIVLNRRHPVGTMLNLSFRLPNETKPFRTRGKIAWVDEFTVGPDKAFDTGIEFLDVDEAKSDAIEQRMFQSASAGSQLRRAG